MTRRLKRIAPLSAAKILATLYGCMGLIFLPFFALSGLGAFLAQHAHATTSTPPPALIAGLMGAGAIFLPVIYAIMGFLFGLIGAAIYNLVARRVGGLEIEVE